ncbi:protein of unknown function [Streptomyces sp. KY75]|nr:protein of unknown function [Streptomyces sp. KY70]CAD5989829.1 protein of unknown function [Streptomyces sp. KY75]
MQPPARPGPPTPARPGVPTPARPAFEDGTLALVRPQAEDPGARAPPRATDHPIDGSVLKRRTGWGRAPGRERAGLGDTGQSARGPYTPRPRQAHNEQQQKGTASWQGFGQGYARWAPSWQWCWPPQDAAAPAASGRKSARPRPPRAGPR